MRLLFLPAVLATPLVLAAQTPAPSLQSLVSNSPFGLANQPGAAQNAVAAPLEFRGTFVDAGERFFSIVDTATRRAEWVGLNDTGHAYVVRNFDPDNETITVEHHGRTLNLKLHSAKIGVLPPAQVAAQPTPQQPANTQANAAPSTAEAQRLAQVAEEIRRRRALRQQAANPQNAKSSPQPPRQP